MANKDVKEAVLKARIKLWQVAARYGCNDSNFSRKLRFELPDEEKNKILRIIDELVMEEEVGTLTKVSTN